MEVYGLDGCPGGWVCASATGVTVVRNLSEVLQRTGAVIGIDMPIGLPAGGARASDRLARQFLPGRASTIFSTPTRDLIDVGDYAATNAASRARHGRGISKQAFNLFARIRELDAFVTAADEERVAEIHPECSFRQMTGQVLVSKHTPAGLISRREAIVERFGEVPERVPGAKSDDILDAYAVLWSATRFSRGEHRTLSDGARDERGLLMRIVV
jgi:predicted RNase H-like nuclease